MKRSLLLFSVLVSMAINAQIEWAPIGAEWYYDLGLSDYIKYMSEKDTLIDGKTCKIITGISAGNETFSHREIMYEESGKVYYYFDDKFRKIYDFTVQKGDYADFEFLVRTEGITNVDTTYVAKFKVKVEEVSTITTANGKDLKKITTSFVDENVVKKFRIGSYTYCEKIGYDYNSEFIPLLTTFFYPAESKFLRCYHDTEIDYISEAWEQLGLSCDFPGGSSSLSEKFGKSNDINIYPGQPGEFVIEFDEVLLNEETIAKLYDISGNVVIKKQINNPTYRFSTSGFPKGMYILKIYTEKELLNVTKLIKK